MNGGKDDAHTLALLGGPSLGLVIDHYGYSVMFASSGVLVVLGAISYAIWDGVVRGGASRQPE